MQNCIVRQPVFGRDGRLFGYEFAGVAIGPNGLHNELPPEALIAELFLDTGIEQIAGGERAFIPVDRDIVIGGRVPALPQERVILALAPQSEIDQALIDGCVALRAGGWSLMATSPQSNDDSALMRFASLAALCAIVRVDVLASPSGLAPAIAGGLRLGTQLLAAHVRNTEERDRWVKRGFELFGGTRFAAPSRVAKKVASIEHLLAFQALQLVRDASANDDDIERVIRRDVGLSYRLLRMVNSAGIGAREVTSIGHALRLLGRGSLARWLYLLMATQFSDSGVNAELFRQALIRARMCEEIADRTRQPNLRGPLFLVGMLSVFDQLLAVPMEVVCDALDLAPALSSALVSRAGAMGEVLELVQRYVDGSWLAVPALTERLGVHPSVMPAIYIEALSWAYGQTSAPSAEPRKSAELVTT